MRPLIRFVARGAAVALVMVALPLSSQTSKPSPLQWPLACHGNECGLLHGRPQTAGMRSGFVRLKPGETLGWHKTEDTEESLVILHGQGEVWVEGQEKRAFIAPAFVYIPPGSSHNVLNTWNEMLEYVYVTAPAAKP